MSAIDLTHSVKAGRIFGMDKLMSQKEKQGSQVFDLQKEG